MPSHIEVRTEISAKLGVGGQIALVATGAMREMIGVILEDEQFEFEPFDDVQVLLGREMEQAPLAVVLSIEDAEAGLTARVEQITQRFVSSPLIIVCPTIERWGVRAALAGGAAGVVLAESIDSTLGPSLQATQAGQICVPRAHWRQVEPPALSSREKQILGLVVMSYTNGQIAKQLFLAESTVKSHLSSAFGKLGVRSRNEAVLLILDPERGLGMGILALGGEPLESSQVL